MAEVPQNLKYTKEHEWVELTGGKQATIGITHHAQEALGDITFIELPSIGKHFKKGEIFGVVESVKAASDLYMPVGGTVVEVNKSLETGPEQVNSSPYANGWMLKIEADNEAEINELLSAKDYAAII
ncbi:MAG: glycine cleavage system protein H [Verrucomicrobia bacterium CG_4_10_14_3_um_filter_43_23]|nr:MAG: glycine cleavage system protein H [Verrucomicrobia bacterium CG1_02_43_26]PIP59054.1 MAG: glycine cleavage system protein H [Verrucomicrobia bacterium CG22_combo_CG10-13_8_21_14_all_43_17]PIX59151.1 MAG: glycine cleavage system protein H [Verrucomicrobia bacterium CG_4_10_14_3_um_filter_43_23]PIY61326.1 MAG: glycine cleavage system protein H [Verrucomicrobia bacterium CG_4_10_14_0_8_um_filter_43_34]PJA44108.1 MAG: glycine cleavage system protein H [Verrucomicrobia bacterium CG_4_9_14_3_